MSALYNLVIYDILGKQASFFCQNGKIYPLDAQGTQEAQGTQGIQGGPKGPKGPS